MNYSNLSAEKKKGTESVGNLERSVSSREWGEFGNRERQKRRLLSKFSIFLNGTDREYGRKRDAEKKEILIRNSF